MGLGFSRVFWLVVGSTFLGFAGIGAIVPLLGPHVKRDLGQSDFVVGCTLGIFSVVALASRLIAGPVTDRKGRKPALLAGLAFCSIAGLAYLVPLGIVSVLIGRILQGVGEAFLFVSAAAWAVEAAPPGRRAQALGYLGAGVWGGLAVGPAIGAMLGSFEHAAWLLVLTPIPAMLALRTAPETLREAHPSAKPPSMIPRHALLPGVVLGFVNVHYPAMAGFLTLHLAAHGNAAGGKAFSAYALVILTCRFFLGGLPDRIGPRITFYFGLASMAAGLFVLSLAPGPNLAMFGAALTGLGFSLPWPSVASTVLNRAHENERAASVGLLTACVDLFVGATSFLDGALAHRYGYETLYWVAIASLCVAGALGHRVTSAKPVIEGDRSLPQPLADLG
jgi:MFS family permease